MALNPRTELLFPPRLIPSLARLRGDEWRKLVEYIASLSETHPDTLAFCLMMIRLNACLGCVSGSYRFMRGCELCSHQTVARFQGTDEELVELYKRAKQDLERADKEHVDLVADTPDPEVVEEE
ncbi:MAG: hypothetical protein JXA93_21475 [Anaerolineae bacterium]|nr:hypothetical protein [Anaerolineae bacterium]